jgi:1,4-alpha-glucan branching enzyme
MNDTLRYLDRPDHRQYHHNLLTFSLMYAFSENFLLPISHDEVVHGKGSLLTQDPGLARRAAGHGARVPRLHVEPPGQGAALHGQRVRAARRVGRRPSLDWWLLDHAAHYRVHALVKELNAIYRGHPALWALDSDPAGFRWLDADDNTGNLLSYLRFGPLPRRRRSRSSRRTTRASQTPTTSTSRSPSAPRDTAARA